MPRQWRFNADAAPGAASAALPRRACFFAYSRKNVGDHSARETALMPPATRGPSGRGGSRRKYRRAHKRIGGENPAQERNPADFCEFFERFFSVIPLPYPRNADLRGFFFSLARRIQASCRSREQQSAGKGYPLPRFCRRRPCLARARGQASFYPETQHRPGQCPGTDCYITSSPRSTFR